MPLSAPAPALPVYGADPARRPTRFFAGTVPPVGGRRKPQDGLCGVCRGAQMAEHEDLATAH
ncbi:hypothetical protein GCM10010388_72400 [Streptomyces mauvecolor]